jgi:uncharacterized protein
MSERSIFEHKVLRAAEILQELKKVLVAFSGGVDSSVLLKLAVDTLGGNNVVAVTAVGPLHPTSERKRAEEIAGLIGARHVFAEDPACRQSEFLKNTPQRCYFCKKALLEELVNLAEEYRVKTIVAGENADDQFDYYPGYKAMMELGVRCPLKEAHISKTEVRSLAQRWNLPNYAAPASPCLVTRVPYGQPITTDLLRQIEQAEGYLHELGFEVARVRVHGPNARIEIHEDEISRFFEATTRSQVLAKFKDLGFMYTSVDLEGYPSGSRNKLVDTAAQV